MNRAFTRFQSLPPLDPAVVAVQAALRAGAEAAADRREPAPFPFPRQSAQSEGKTGAAPLPVRRVPNSPGV